MQNPLNIFPELLTYGLMAPFILRVFLGGILIYFAYLKFFSERDDKAAFFESVGMKPGSVFTSVIGAAELTGGVMLVIGFYTQVAAIVAAGLMLAAVYIKWRHPQALRNDIEFYVLLFVVALSLLFTGAGFFAFDLPL